jgi:hypothetical protein
LSLPKLPLRLATMAYTCENLHRTAECARPRLGEIERIGEKCGLGAKEWKL